MAEIASRQADPLRAEISSERDVTARADRNRQPEVDEPPANDRLECDIAGNTEALEEEDCRRFEDSETAGREREHGEHIADAVCSRKSSTRLRTGGTGEEGQKARSVEQPVERTPNDHEPELVTVAPQGAKRVADMPDDGLDHAPR